MREVKSERTSRMYFGKIHDVIEMPNLIQVQKDSYEWFKRSFNRMFSNHRLFRKINT